MEREKITKEEVLILSKQSYVVSQKFNDHFAVMTIYTKFEDLPQMFTKLDHRGMRALRDHINAILEEA